MTRNLFLIIIILSFSLRLFGQINNFRKWSVKEGLSQSDVFSIEQDSRGFIWIGTGGGLTCYDGASFIKYSEKEGLKGNVIRDILCDFHHLIWIATDKGLYTYNGKKFESVSIKGLSGSNVLSLQKSENNLLWAGTDDDGLFCLNVEGNKINLVKRFFYQADVFPVFDIEELSNYKLAIGTLGGGIKFINTSTKEVLKSTVNDPAVLNIISLYKTANNVLWAGTYGSGAYEIVIKDNSINIKNSFNNKFNISDWSVWGIKKSGDGRIWFATDQGAIEYNKEQNNYNFYTSKEGLSGNKILSLFCDKENHMWFGTNGDGLNMLQNQFFSHYNVSSGLTNNKIQSIVQDKQNNYWIAASEGGLVKAENVNNKINFKSISFPKELNGTNVICIFSGNDFNKNIWLGSTTGLLKYDGYKFYRYSIDNGLIDDKIYSVFVDTKGIVWCGTAAGISRFDGSKFVNLSTEALGMHNQGVKCITEDKDGNVWFGTADGLVKYNESGSVTTYDEAEGLLNKDINAIAADFIGNIWIATNSGEVYKFNTLTKSKKCIELVEEEKESVRSLIFQNDSTLLLGTFTGTKKLVFNKKLNKIIFKNFYDQNDGFIGLECNDNSILKDNTGKVWVGTVNGLTIYNPNKEFDSNYKPLLNITDVQLFYKHVNWDSLTTNINEWFITPSFVNLSYNQNHITFKFKAISTGNAQKIKYKYLLEGSDLNWSPERSVNEITFSSLEPGEYTFKVMAITSNHLQSEIKQIKFIISPPWYKTTAFYLICILTIGVIVVLVVKQREKKLVEEKVYLEKVVAERTAEVRIQKEHLAEKNKEITDSINYAKGIQVSMLPPLQEILDAHPEVFIFFQPKDIVSGDFYWFEKINEDEFLIAIADCTGHGVPGGFMSMVCADKLHDAVKITTEPSRILYETNNSVKKALRQQLLSDGSSKDGMEICLLKINKKTCIITYSGANRPLWVVNGKTGELQEIKPTKASIASFTPYDFEFDQHELQLSKGDLIYSSSDGYPDQFGGPEERKFMTKNLKNLITINYSLPMTIQHQAFKDEITLWMKDVEQVDDILLLGIRL